MDHLTPATIPFDIMSLPTCCGNSCGMLFPLVSNGSYLDPRGEGKTFVAFKLAGSPLCGIPVAKVLRGDLEGLIERDELAKLNPNAGSIRLRIELPGYNKVSPKINTPNDRFKIEDLVHRVCDQVDAFIKKAQVSGGTAPRVNLGEGGGGIAAGQLVLVSLKRVSVGSWAPCVRFINDQDFV